MALDFKDQIKLWDAIEMAIDFLLFETMCVLYYIIL